MSFRIIEPLFASTEGKMLCAGLILSGLMLMVFGIGWYLYTDSVFYYAAMAGLNMVIGRAAGMTFGYASGLSHLQVVPINILVESIQVLVVYPLFALSWQKMISPRPLQTFFIRMQRAAETHRDIVHKFGIVGLFVFVFVPFWMTGPVVGSIIGYLIGLRPWVNLVVVLAATYLAIILWALLLNELSAWAATVNRYAPYALFAAIVLLIVAVQLLRQRRNRSR